MRDNESRDSAVRLVLRELDEQTKKRIRDRIRVEYTNLLLIDEFSFFDDKLFFVEYGLTTTDDEDIVLYTRLRCFSFPAHEPVIPSSLDSYKRATELERFPTSQYLEERIKN